MATFLENDNKLKTTKYLQNPEHENEKNLNKSKYKNNWKKQKIEKIILKKFKKFKRKKSEKFKKIGKIQKMATFLENDNKLKTTKYV